MSFPSRHCERSEATQEPPYERLGCFALLAMTNGQTLQTVSCRAHKAIRAAFLALAAALLVSTTVAALPRVVSINLCTDQFLVALADLDQILGLSPYARDRSRSGIARQAEGLLVLSGTAEEVLVLRPDIVLAGRFTARATREMLRAHGLQVVELDVARSVDQARDQLRQIGVLLGQPDRTAAAVARLDAALDRMRRIGAGRPTAGRPTILPLERRGWVAGGETLLGSVLAASGLVLAGAGPGQDFGGFMPLERIVALHPDLLLVSETGARAEDQGAALLDHPALARLYPAAKRVPLPSAASLMCGGPGLAEGIDRLADALDRAR